MSVTEPSQLRIVFFSALSAALAACHPCRQSEDADSIRAAQLAHNVALAESAMRDAATRVNAELLAIAPKALARLTLCASANDPIPGGLNRDTTCEPWTSDDGRVFRIADSRKVPRIAITTRVDDWPYVRLARRGNTFFVLEPKLTRHTVDRETECECDGMPRPLEEIFYGFIVDDVPGLSVGRIEVPVTEDVIEWECKSWAV